MELGLRVFFYHGVHGVSRRLHGVSYFNHKSRPDNLMNASGRQELRSDGEHKGNGATTKGHKGPILCNNFGWQMISVGAK